MNKLSCALLAFAVSPVFAADLPDFDYIELAYSQLSLDRNDNTPSGLVLRGSYTVLPYLYVTGSYASLSESLNGYDLKYNNLSSGFGSKFNVSENWAVYAEITYENEDGLGNGYHHADGYGVAAGVRGSFYRNLQTDIKYKYEDWGPAYIESAGGVEFTAHYYFDTGIAAGIGYEINDEYNAGSLSIRYSF
ncbi:MAG: hypothetical protein GYB58_11395 [Gammaproteobacteria bacterium]|nr:hypothetical protein [Gammaproteobacteria bacterium]